MTEGLLEKASLLMQQNRYDDAEKILGQLLTSEPNNDYLLYMLAEVNLQKENYGRAEDLINSAIGLDPDMAVYFFLKARLYLVQDKYKLAEEYVTQAINMEPHEPGFFAFWAQIKLFLKLYDDALNIANQALALDASHVFALNVRSTALLKLNRKEESFDTIAGALHENPNDAYTHSNYGWGLLEKGDNKKALEHFKEALKNDPNSVHAQAGMTEAIKARFMVYRWFLQYAFWMGNMASKYQWFFILGVYFGTKFLSKIADSNEALRPFLMPVIVLLVLFAFSTWIIGPISNLFLRLNPYGKHLLNKEEKIVSSVIGISLLISLLSIAAFAFTGIPALILLAFFAFTMMIPFSKLFAKPLGVFITYNIIMLFLGALAIGFALITGELLSIFATIYVFGLLGFQFISNYYQSRL